MPYVNRYGNAWVCWNCIGGHCSMCINTTLTAVDDAMRVCDCDHPAKPGWVVVAEKHEQMTRPVTTEYHSPDTGPIPVIRQERKYSEPWWTRRVS